MTSEGLLLSPFQAPLLSLLALVPFDDGPHLHHVRRECTRVTTPVLSARGFQEGREATAISLVYVFSSFPIIYGKPCALDFRPWKSPTTADIHTGGLSGICSRRVHTDLSLLRETHKMEHYSAQKKEGNLETCSDGDGWPLRTAVSTGSQTQKATQPANPPSHLSYRKSEIRERGQRACGRRNLTFSTDAGKSLGGL